MANLVFNLQFGLRVSHLHDWAYTYENRIGAFFEKFVRYVWCKDPLTLVAPLVSALNHKSFNFLFTVLNVMLHVDTD